jgi:hypothetical protein
LTEYLFDNVTFKRDAMKEVKVRDYLVAGVEELGGTAELFRSPGKRHVPDVLICWPPGLLESGSWRAPITEFVETKAPGKTARTGQERDHKRRRKMGYHVYVLGTIAEVDIYLAKRRMMIANAA